MNRHMHEPTQSAVKLDGAPQNHEYSVCECGELIAKFFPDGQWVESTNQRHPYRVRTAASIPEPER